MRIRILAAAVFVSSVLLAGRAEADVYWSSIATACTPDSASIRGDRYVSAPDNKVAPGTGDTDPIVLICHVPPRPDQPLPHLLSMTYLDSTGTATTAKVQAQLIRASRTTGARAVIAAVSSNTTPNQTTLAYRKSALFAHVLDHETNFYYVRIDIDRAAANQTVQSIGVALESTCGDGVVSAWEGCDDSARVNGDGCSAACTVEDGYECTGSPSVCNPLCGNGVKDTGESCDGTNLGGEDCVSRGFTSGTLACNANCTFDTSGCASAVCGNNTIESGESCDGADLGGETCQSQGFFTGTLACNPDCTFNTSGCQFM